MLRRLVILVVLSIVSGVGVAAAALPLAVVSGFGLRSASDGWQALPGYLRTPRPAQVSYVYANDGKTLITAFYNENRRDVPLEQIAPILREAVVAAEDVRFYQHHGVDAKGVVRAFVTNVRGGDQQGASTLTMQYVRNVLKSDPGLTAQQRLDATADTPARKVREMKYSIELERRLTKSEILNRYLNIAYFGAGAYGIFAASQTYFGKPASELTLGEAALLAGLLQSPDADNPISGDRAAALARREYVLGALEKERLITPEERAAVPPLQLNPRREPNSCASIAPQHNDWGFFCDYLRQWWNAQPAFGATPEDRDDALNTGGYTIISSLDPGVQAAALSQSLGVYGYGKARALPLAVVVPGSGHVLAMAVNRHYSVEPGPGNTVNQLVAGGVGVSGYQAGSTFKMFTMLAALEAGLPLSTAFRAPSALATQWPASGPGSCGGRWCPANDSPKWMDGVRTMWNGFGRSVNTYFVWLEQQVGPQRAIAMAQRLGITLRSSDDQELAKQPNNWGSFTLGTALTSPLDLANAYATLAAGGVYCAPLPVVSITDPDGQPVAAANPNCRHALDPDVAAAAVDAARCPVGQQSTYKRCDGGTAPQVSAILGRPVAGKTGSSEYNRTETFVGITRQLAAAAIATNPDTPSDAVGGGVAGSVDDAVAHTMAAALGGQPALDFPVPSRRIALG